MFESCLKGGRCRRLGLLAAACLLGSSLFQTFCSLGDVGNSEELGLWTGFDLRLRTHEAECLVQGFDPYDVWTGSVKLNGYVPFESSGAKELWASQRSNTKILHVYPPWSYSMILPMLGVPDLARYAVYTILELVVLVVLAFGCLSRPRFKEYLFPVGILSLGVASNALPNVVGCIYFGNYGILIAGAVAMALWCHNAGKDLLAGLFWAMTMVKPQIGLLFFVALMALGRWRTMICASVILLLLTMPPSMMCGHSPIRMVMGIFDYTSYDYFPFQGFLTKALVAAATECGLRWLPMAVGLVVGIVPCFCLTRLFAVSRDYFVRFIPAVLLSTVWAVGGWAHDHSLDAIALASLVFLMAEKQSPSVWIFASFVALTTIGRLWGITSLPIPNVAVAVMIIALFGLGYSLRQSRYFNFDSKTISEQDKP